MPSSPRFMARRLAIVFSLATLSGSAFAADFTYSPVDSGSDLWSTGANWSAVPVSGIDTRLTFVADNATVLPDGFGNTNTNNIAGAFDLNILDLQGTGPAAGSATVTIGSLAPSTGLRFVANGETAPTPTINLLANNGDAGTLTYNVSTPVELTAANTAITGNGSANFRFDGGITGTGAITKSGTSTLVLGGTTSINALEIGRNAVGGSLIAATGSQITIGVGQDEANLNVGLSVDQGSAGQATAIFDASAASQLTIDVGMIRVGNMLGGNGNGIGQMTLAANSDVTASYWFLVGYSNNSFKTGVSTLSTADGGTVNISTPRFTIGGAKANATFHAGVGSTINLDAPVTGENPEGRAILEVGRFIDNVAGTGNWTGTADFSAGVLNAKLSRLVVGGLNAANSASETGIMTIGDSAANHLDISGAGTVVHIGWHETGSGTANGTLTIGNLDATSSITSTNSDTAVLIGSGGAGQATGTLNLDGGTLTITTEGSAIAGGGGTSTVNFNGTTLRVGAGSANWITGLTTANLGAGGARIDTNGFDIGSDQVFSGAGALVKIGVGDLRLSGASTFTGDTVVEGGTLTIAAGGMLSSENVIVLDTAINLTLETIDALVQWTTLSLEGGGAFGEADAGALNLLADATVSGLVLDGEIFGEGTYGSSESDAMFKNDEFFSGEGVLTVVPEPSTIALFGLGALLALGAVRARNRKA